MQTRTAMWSTCKLTTKQQHANYVIQLVHTCIENQIVIWDAVRDYPEKYKKTWVMQLNDNELKPEKYGHDRQMRLIEHR